MTRAHDHTLVIDIGKSNARVLVLASDGSVASQASRANAPSAGPGYTALGVDALQHWLIRTVPTLSSRERVGRAAVSTHGAAFCAIDDDGLVLPPIDYEWDGYGAHRAGFEAGLDPFSHTGSPLLPMGLNAALQLHWVREARPEAWTRIRHWLPYPQYWAWWLSGVAASEVSSLGCHTQLWSPAGGRFSQWAVDTGVAGRFAPLRPAWEVLGPLTPAMARLLDLPPGCEVVCGVHDSNACLAPYLDTPHATLLTTGTWTIAMAPGADAAGLTPGRDELINVAVDGRAVPTARFMGGREFDALCAGAPASGATPQALADVVSTGWHALPAFAEAGGPYRGRRGSVYRGGQPASVSSVPAPLRPALASWYCALMSHQLVCSLGAVGPVIVDGPLARNAAFGTALAALLGDQRPLLRSIDTLEGTARGTARLARWASRHGHPPCLDTLAAPVAPLAASLRRHADDWRQLVC